MNIKLATKIYNVMCESSGLTKDMSVGGQYQAISEKAVLNEIKPLLKLHKLILIPIAAEVNQEGKMTQLTAKYKIVDIETGEFEILETVGNGTDSQDKGSGKAWTYAYKCLIQKTFCLFSGEDTDNTHSDDLGKDNKTDNKNDNKNETPATDKITTKQLIDMAKLKGYDEAYLCTKASTDEVKFIKAIKKKEYYDALSKLPNK